ncbi:GNAT family N-acetyltransferase [Rhodohalobacter sp.]|uniref:GNAT family N-acetyltransferase n=1 Tax=Rhodohalobacter sp. TaxID=1974210 RepID=UPI002ACD427D|nr:GNAT family N-acetyltransferase [Rhodohalobacter sp.]MDZ7757950.1 GNAT family N-acetyltransferase [Rhodohalobacter sp.]
MKFILYHGIDEMSSSELYDILKLRQDIFIVEQDCVYDDIDGLDGASQHLLLKTGDELAAYSRIVPPMVKFDEISIGRIVVKMKFRGSGYGKKIVMESINRIAEIGHKAIRIEAQAHLVEFYENLGFNSAGETYIVDGIPHLQMVRNL